MSEMFNNSELIVQIEELLEQHIPIDPDHVAASFAEQVSVVQLVTAGVVAHFATVYGRDAARELADEIAGSLDDSVDARLKIASLN